MCPLLLGKAPQYKKTIVCIELKCGIRAQRLVAVGVVIRVKGDGRTYQMRFGSDARLRSMEVSFSADFKTRNGELAEISIPFNAFSGSFRGMLLDKQIFNPWGVRRMGLLLGDKKAGSFELQVDWIRCYGSNSDG